VLWLNGELSNVGEYVGVSWVQGPGGVGSVTESESFLKIVTKSVLEFTNGINV